MLGTLLFVALFAAAANCAPQGITFGKDGTVGASFGGYTASAGLGGLLGGNTGPKGNLFAQAGTPLGHFASAGLGGTAGPGGPQGTIYSGAFKPQKHGFYSGESFQAQPTAVQVVQPIPQPQPVVAHVVEPQPAVQVLQPAPQPVGTVYKPQGTLFNDIFNIPISTLHAVNRYLNNKNSAVAVVPAVPVYITGRSNTESKAESEAKSISSSSSTSDASNSISSAAAAASSSSSSSSSSSASTSSSSSSSSSTNSDAGSDKNDGGYVQGVLVSKSYPKNYDNIFNIPISVLRSVNNLLNG